MAVGTQTVRLWRCDVRDCQIAGRYADDALAKQEGWTILTFTSDSRQYALCRKHYLDIERTLSQMGAIE